MKKTHDKANRSKIGKNSKNFETTTNKVQLSSNTGDARPLGASDSERVRLQTLLGVMAVRGMPSEEGRLASWMSRRIQSTVTSSVEGAGPQCLATASPSSSSYSFPA
eukprot:2842914-Amphidinium_carterae.1